MSVPSRSSRISKVYNTCSQWSPFSSTVGKRLATVLALHISQKIKERDKNIDTIAWHHLWITHEGKMTIHRCAWIMNVFPRRNVTFILSLPVSLQFCTITLSFKKKLSPCHRGKCQSNPGVSSHFRALQHILQHENYRLRKEESVLYCHLRSEVGISLRAISLLCILFLSRFVKY